MYKDKESHAVMMSDCIMIMIRDSETQAFCTYE